MPSRSLSIWQGGGAHALDEIEAAHAAVGGTGRGRRYATQQINHAYAVMLSAQFQRFCRDLHSEAVDHLTSTITSSGLRYIVRLEFMRDRRLDRGNPNPGNIGSDYDRIGFEIWPAVYRHDPRNRLRREHLEMLNVWRNAIAHQDFDSVGLGGRSTLRVGDVRRWRLACNALTRGFDLAVHDHLRILTGVAPW